MAHTHTHTRGRYTVNASAVLAFTAMAVIAAGIVVAYVAVVASALEGGAL